MKAVLLSLLCIFLIQESPAQSDSIRNNIYEWMIRFTSTSHAIRGQLNEAGDSSISFFKKNVSEKKFRTDEFTLIKLPVSEIDGIRVCRKYGAGRGALHGFVIGAVLGGLIGLSGGNAPGATAASKAFGIGTGMGILGAMTGAIAGGLAIISIRIDGKQEYYEKYRPFLNENSVVKNPPSH